MSRFNSGNVLATLAGVPACSHVTEQPLLQDLNHFKAAQDWYMQLRLRSNCAVQCRQYPGHRHGPVKPRARLEGGPVGGDVQAGVNVGEQRLADDHVVWAGVVVQLLVPLLHHAALCMHPYT